VHAVLSMAENVPGMQFVGVSMRAVGQTVPAGHDRHADRPLTGPYLPAEQGAAKDVPLQYMPG
jgi:hypothetical protein